MLFQNEGPNSTPNGKKKQLQRSEKVPIFGIQVAGGCSRRGDLESPVKRDHHLGGLVSI